MNALRDAGAHQAVTALLDRDPAAHVTLNDAHGVAVLLNALQQAGAHQAVQVLLDRAPATQADLAEPRDIAELLNALRKAGAHNAADLLAKRADAHAGQVGAHQAAEAPVTQRPVHPRPYGWETDGRRAAPWTWDVLSFPA